MAEVVLAEQTYQFVLLVDNIYVADIAVGALTLTEGETYDVSWDGTSYTCVARSFSLDSITGIGIGNFGIVGDTNTGEPFLIGVSISDSESACYTLDAADHTFGITKGSATTPKIILKDWDGTDVVYEGIQTVTLPTEDGGTVQFSSPETVENAITQAIADVTAEDITVASADVNFAEGEMVISAPDGKMVQNVTVKSPANLLPENIAEGIDIAGVVGTLASGGGGLPNVLVKTVDIPATSGMKDIASIEELASIGFSTSKNCLVMANRICNDPLTLSNIRIVFHTWSANYAKNIGDIARTETDSCYYYNGKGYRASTSSDSDPFAGNVSSAIYYSSAFGTLAFSNSITSTSIHNMVGKYLVVVICFD